MIRLSALTLYFLVCAVPILGNYYDLLEVPRAADVKEVKKAYRRLALEFHPDKLLQQNLTASEVENKTDHFILVQEAYETLSDDRKRYLYDSSLSGVDTVLLDSEPESHTLFPFQLLVRTRRLAIELNALFPAKIMPDIEIDVLVSAATVFTGHVGNHSIFRQRKCPSCGGNGGHAGESRACSLCEGRGHANHLLRDRSRGYLHIASTTCHSCGGKGVHPLGTCEQCRGRGFVLQEETLQFHLPAGWPHLYRLRYPGKGHHRAQGEEGGVVLTFHYDFPAGWSLAEGGGAGDVQLRVDVPVERYTRGFTERITTLDGRQTEVRVEPASDLLSVTENFVLKKGFGLLSDAREAGDLHVWLVPQWDDTPASVWEHFLREMLKSENSTHSYHKMLALFRLFGARKARRRGGSRMRSAGGGGEDISLQDVPAS